MNIYKYMLFVLLSIAFGPIVCMLVFHDVLESLATRSPSVDKLAKNS